MWFFWDTLYDFFPLSNVGLLVGNPGMTGKEDLSQNFYKEIMIYGVAAGQEN